ncbi:MAG: MFS transporter [Phenylobacterium sp.]|uniref:spinster family MFS transporter n=1 Tax=Phenylobacterium sp. TaxID=1871053 RepID=UPI0025D0DA9F|nr:MFS transporter [Phenylobacterium sp.]MCA3731779.1 MFS transporter [Phenylobacterium sp.]MCA3757839.1 MFS transporter [Phenylobacterium sp.]
MTETATPSADPIVPPPTASISEAPFSAAYTRYAMLLLLAIYTINFLDRSIINILAEPIKNELKLADWQLGLMSGLAFALFYTVLGIPLAQLAERRNRPIIIGTSVAVWSGFTALSGATTNFVQLVLCRIGVGVGEAGCTPPAHSLIADYVPKEKRASALAFYSMGTPLGGLLGLVMGGLIADAYGWRVAFLVAGVPGLLFALLCFLTLREPRKILAAHSARVTAAQATFRETLAYLMKKKTFWLIALGAAIKAFIGYGHAPFTASFFLRVHSEEISRLAAKFDLGSVGFMGLALGLMGGTAGIISSWLGGQIADRFAKTDLRGYVVVPAIASLIAVPIYIIAVSVPSASVALWILVINGLLGSLWYGPVYAIGQSIVPPHMRATASAILLFVINLIGLGLGPTVVGIISDVMANGVGLGSAQGVRWALMISTCFGVLAFAFFWIARKTIREEMES